MKVVGEFFHSTIDPDEVAPGCIGSATDPNPTVVHRVCGKVFCETWSDRTHCGPNKTYTVRCLVLVQCPSRIRVAIRQ